ncbi:bifunctional response regulator/alkaline phosphatase family protein [Algivirga pacifica]|uniref:PglZ domain-containing protein n=1 Tax=Algivirga pacifica TaxID=1162670 RepID=A0ABP9D537_9BACT
MTNYAILWADDEIDLLKPHIMFLQNKGYEVTPVLSGVDALEKCQEENYDIIFLDENMPGMTGLEALEKIKVIRPNVPVVMITKSEEEYIMEEAIGSKIADYLIKPINPKQVLLSVKKLLDKKRLVSEHTNHSYQRDFRNISMAFGDDLDHNDWAEVYQKLVYWELEINQTENKSMIDVLEMQKVEANNNFAKFIASNYKYWLSGEDEGPLLSHQLVEQKVLPHLNEGEPLFMVVVDNLRFDQWKILESALTDYYVKQEECPYYSILPTTTAYARNAIFSGLLPAEMKQCHPNLWVDEDVEEGKNNHEHDFFKEQLKRQGLNLKTSYHKVIHVNQGKQVLEQLPNLFHNDLNVLVYNFVDMLSHARTDTDMVRELAPDEAAYRSLTKSWFMHSHLLETLKIIAQKGYKVIITTDHGTVRVKRPHKIIGDRNTNTNLRYKQGKNLSYDRKNVLQVLKPEEYHLPKVNVSTSYAFATEDYFFAYPNNYNHYVKYYKDTFQHGGISLEEVIVPFAVLKGKG